jgi:hypothetical protein
MLPFGEGKSYKSSGIGAAVRPKFHGGLPQLMSHECRKLWPRAMNPLCAGMRVAWTVAILDPTGPDLRSQLTNRSKSNTAAPKMIRVSGCARPTGNNAFDLG